MEAQDNEDNKLKCWKEAKIKKKEVLDEKKHEKTDE